MPTDGPTSVPGSPDALGHVRHDGGVAVWRRRTAGTGLVALVALAVFGTLGGDQVLAGVAFVGLATGTVLMWVELGQVRRRNVHGQRAPAAQAPTDATTRPQPSVRRGAPLLAVGLTVAVAAGAVQTWYTPGTALAGGDLAPPNGTAWLGKLFSSWAWSGSDLGRPSSLETELPWAALLWLVHETGGSSMLAQRVWYTVLFAGAALGALWLLRLLQASWVAATAGSLLYLFNPFVVSTVGINQVFLAALVLVVVVPAIVLSVSSGRWRCRTGAVALVATVPLIGYAYENPPLILAVAAAGLVAVAVPVLWLGRPGGRRVMAFLVLGVPLAAVASLYWVVPSLEQLHFDAVQQLSTLSRWTWTETRSTLANAFWLNTSWAWPFKEYVPYNGNYATLPLSMLRYAFPIIGFAALSFRYGPSAKSVRRLTVVASAATGSLLIIFMSTGTRLPGSVLFDPIYHLPYGWLLQEPGRFLLLAGVGYAAMGVVTLDTWMARLDRAVGSVRGWSSGRQLAVKIPAAVSIVGVVALAPGYPLAFGAIAPGPRPDSMPSTHVRVPRYWTDMASYLNGPGAPPGNVLVLPPDPFYQMLYTWGYYGNDAFITDMIRRNVLDPSGQGYGAAGPALIAAVNQVASSLLAGDDVAANRILRALGTPDVLVRGDIAMHDPVASPDPPQALAKALRGDPAIELVRRFGPLSLYRLHRTAVTLAGVHTGVPYATTQAAMPDLLVLSILPEGTAIIRHAPMPGVPDVVQVPGEASWKLQGGELRTVLALPPRRSYAVSELGTRGDASATTVLPPGASATVGTPPVRIRVDRVAPTKVLAELSTPVGGNELGDGSFASGTWGVVGNCDAVPGTHPDLTARLGPAPRSGIGKALVLSASGDIACETKEVDWHRGSVLLTLSAREVAGSGPAICLWEVGPNRCASLPAPDALREWRTYQQVVTPPPGTRGISLFLYAEAGSSDAYADVGVRSLVPSAPLMIVAAGGRADHHPLVLTTADSTFSAAWTVSGAEQHVLVNGVANGWLSDTNRPLTPRDAVAPIVDAGFAATFAAAVATMLLACSVGISTLLARRTRRQVLRSEQIWNDVTGTETRER